MDPTLRDRWHALCERVGAFKKADESDLTFEMLQTLYAHPPRTYHTLEHIRQCLETFDSVRLLAEDKDTVEFALWLHDCVYFAERPDNEDRSADAAAMVAGLLGCPPGFPERVRELISVTRHSTTPEKGDAALVADIDLSILAAEPGAYDAYAGAIRAEFVFAPDEAFRVGRAAFIQRMLDRDRIYATRFFSRELEGKARANLERERHVLESGRLL